MTGVQTCALPISYAKAQNVGIHVWKAGGNTTEADIKSWAAQGVKGCKLDFCVGEDQHTFQNIYDPIIRWAAENKIMVNFHTGAGPSGQERTWPNILTWEHVKGDEFFAHHQWQPFTAEHFINVVLTRNVIGPMDFTPVILSPLIRAGSTNPSTYASQMAHAVMFESGLQHFSESIYQNYVTNNVVDFFKAIPVAWDDIHLVNGQPDSFVCLARRKGHDWFIGANQMQAGTMAIPLDFLDPGASYEATIYQDGAAWNQIAIVTQTVSSVTTLQVSMLATGGCAVQCKQTVPVTAGLVLRLDASRLAGLNDGQQVNTWNDLSGLGNHATRDGSSPAGYPQIKTNQLNGLPVIRFAADAASGFNFPQRSDMRTIFWVVKENVPGRHFIVGAQDK